MPLKISLRTKKILLTSVLSLGLTACSAADRLANVGAPPEMTKIENPQLKNGYKPVSMPMPAPKITSKLPNSLWASDRKGFFKDQRASDIGDILTVMININDEAEMENETERSRRSNENADLNNILGYEDSLAQILPEAVSNTDLVDLTGDSVHNGAGEIEREEQITVRLAAVITQILPNGNLVISGSQEVLVNFEKRILQIDGIIRPQDISVNNSINHDQIAEARIVYGGKGHITDVQQPRYGQQLYDIFFPF